MNFSPPTIFTRDSLGGFEFVFVTVKSVKDNKKTRDYAHRVNIVGGEKKEKKWHYTQQIQEIGPPSS